MSARTLPLADGCVWRIAAGNAAAEPCVARLGQIMQLAEQPVAPAAPVHDLQLVVDEPCSQRATRMPEAVCAVRSAAPVRWQMDPPDGDEELLFAQVMQFTTLFGVRAQRSGGALIHGALAARCHLSGSRTDDELAGVLLAAPGGTGKSTAARRLPPPWLALCDDTTLVVRDGAGAYWAHPWPTWSRFLWGGAGGSWHTAQAVRLSAIFFLRQAAVDRATPVGAGQAAAALVQSIEQVSRLMARNADAGLARTLHAEWFAVAAGLAQAIPCFELQLTLTGAFWTEIEKAMDAL